MSRNDVKAEMTEKMGPGGPILSDNTQWWFGGNGGGVRRVDREPQQGAGFPTQLSLFAACRSDEINAGACVCGLHETRAISKSFACLGVHGATPGSSP